MTLILGVHLAKRFWLVSDTRVSYPDGTHKDDLIKVFRLSSKVNAIAAGKADSASYLLTKIEETLDEDATITEFKDAVKSELTEAMKEYVNETGRYGKNALIVGGFDPTKKKKIASGRLGDYMAAIPKAAGEGVRVEQYIDPDIRDPLAKAIQRSSPKPLEGHIAVEINAPHSELLTLTLDLQTLDWEMKKIKVYDYAVYHPNQSFVEVKLPEDVIAHLEFRGLGAGGDQALYDEAGVLMTFVSRAARDHHFVSVGGNIFPMLALPEGNAFPTGDLARRENDTLYLSSITVKETDMYYKLEDGSEGKYRWLQRLRNPGEMELPI